MRLVTAKDQFSPETSYQGPVVASDLAVVAFVGDFVDLNQGHTSTEIV